MDEYEQIQNEFLEMRDSAEDSNLLKEIKCLESIIYMASGTSTEDSGPFYQL